MQFFKRFRSKPEEYIGTLIARADAARDRKDWREAAEAYQDTLVKNPELPDIWVQYAHVLKEDGTLEDAVSAYRQALKKKHDDAETHVHLAHLLKRLQRTDEAATAFEQAIDLNPSDLDSARELSALQEEQSTPPPWSQADFREFEIAASHSAQMAALQTLYKDALAENDLLREQVHGQQEEMGKCQSMLEAFEVMASAERRLLEQERDAAIEQASALEEEVARLSGQSVPSE